MSEGAPLNVLVVDDSATVREALRRILSSARGVTVTTAPNPLVAMARMTQQRPDVIVTDLEMPRMDGLTFLRRIMAEAPVPVVVCSALTGHGTQAALEALELGAVGIVAKPRLGVKQFLEESAVTLQDAVRGAAAARLRRPTRAMAPQPVPPPVATRAAGGRVVVIGASTGGTEALRVVLEALPPDAPGSVIVQHMPAGFTHAFARRLDDRCRVEVREAASGDRVLDGRALIAPGNRHLTLERNRDGYVVAVSDGPLVSRHRPSVDVLFRSAARVAGRNAIGVLMTGMGADGAQGLLELKRAGASTLAQDEESCVVFGMPKEAIALGAVDEVVGLSRIAGRVLDLAAVPRREQRL